MAATGGDCAPSRGNAAFRTQGGQGLAGKLAGRCGGSAGERMSRQVSNGVAFGLGAVAAIFLLAVYFPSMLSDTTTSNYGERVAGSILADIWIWLPFLLLVTVVGVIGNWCAGLALVALWLACRAVAFRLRGWWRVPAYAAALAAWLIFTSHQLNGSGMDMREEAYADYCAVHHWECALGGAACTWPFLR